MHNLLLGVATAALLCAGCQDDSSSKASDGGVARTDGHAAGDGSVGDGARTVDSGLRADMGAAADAALDMAPAPDAATPRGRLTLTRGPSTSMPVGTHRPEIRAASDGTLVVAVVEPSRRDDGLGQVKHQVYRMDAALNQMGEPFVITRIAAPYGEPADHRIALVNDEIVVVYQTLNYQDGERPMNGPSEPFATDQSLMLARFGLDGEELFRGPIVDQTSDFEIDNFPDHCLLWRENRLLVSSGSRSRSVHIREVGLDAAILADHVLPTRRDDGISGDIGNSMHLRGDGIGYFSSNSPAGNGALTLTAVDGDFGTSRLTELGGNDGMERHFPTDSRMLGEYTLVTYIARPADGAMGLEENPYGPRLMVFDSANQVVEDIEIGSGGFAHVHPTMTILGDQLLVAWSKRSDRRAPQVHIESFTISWE